MTTIKIDIMIKRKIEVEIEPTAVELAVEFSDSDSDYQAKFLSQVAHEFAEFGKMKRLDQMYFISQSKFLTDEAKQFIKTLNDYIN